MELCKSFVSDIYIHASLYNKQNPYSVISRTEKHETYGTLTGEKDITRIQV